MKLIIGISLAAALAGCTQGQRSPVTEANNWAVATANPLGPPVSCITHARVRGTTARDDRTLDLLLDDGRLLRNRLPNACVGMARENRFLYRTSTERLCSTDLITVVGSDGRAGVTCGLGMFQEISLPNRPVVVR